MPRQDRREVDGPLERRAEPSTDDEVRRVFPPVEVVVIEPWALVKRRGHEVDPFPQRHPHPEFDAVDLSGLHGQPLPEVEAVRRVDHLVERVPDCDPHREIIRGFACERFDHDHAFLARANDRAARERSFDLDAGDLDDLRPELRGGRCRGSRRPGGFVVPGPGAGRAHEAAEVQESTFRGAASLFKELQRVLV